MLNYGMGKTHIANGVAQERRKSQVSPIARSAHSIKNCLGCQEIFMSERCKKEQDMQEQGLNSIKKAIKVEKLTKKIGFQKLLTLLYDPFVTPKQKLERQIILSKKIEQILNILSNSKTMRNVTEDQIFQIILDNFEDLTVENAREMMKEDLSGAESALR